MAAVLGLLVRLLYLRQLQGAPFWELRLGDAAAYHEWAQRIASGDWLGHDVFYQSPLYPYFLAVVYRFLGSEPGTVRVAHAFLGAASCGLLSYAGVKLFGRRGLAAGALLAIYPAAIFLDGQLDKTALSTMLLCAVLAAYASRRWIVAGAALGLLVLTRENALVLGIPLLAAAGGRDRLRFGTALTLVLLPVTVRNYAISHEWHLTTAQSGPNLYIGNHAHAPGWYEPLVTGHGSAADERADAVRLAEEAEHRRLTPAEVSSYWTGRAAAFLRERPAEWLALFGRKLALTVNSTEIADTESQAVAAEYAWVLLVPLPFGMLLAAAALNVTGGKRVLWSMAAIYALSVAVFYVMARYRFPLVPILLLLAVSIPRRRPSKGAIAGTVTAAAIAFLPLVDPRPARATNYYAIAAASTNPDDAAAFYRRALDVDPQFAGAHFGLATVLTKQDRTVEALPHFAAAVAGWPDHEEARFNYGLALVRAGREAEAVTQLEAAVRLRGDDADARIALAQTLVGMGRPVEAIPQLLRAVEIAPAKATVHANLGAVLANEGRFDEALPHLERALELNPGDETARRNLAEARRLAGR